MAATVIVAQRVVPESHQMQNRGVQIAEVNFAFDCASTRVVGAAVDVAAFDAAAGQPEGKAFRIVAGFVLAVVRR